MLFAVTCSAEEDVLDAADEDVPAVGTAALPTTIVTFVETVFQLSVAESASMCVPISLADGVQENAPVEAEKSVAFTVEYCPGEPIIVSVSVREGLVRPGALAENVTGEPTVAYVVDAKPSMTTDGSETVIGCVTLASCPELSLAVMVML